MVHLDPSRLSPAAADRTRLYQQHEQEGQEQQREREKEPLVGTRGPQPANETARRNSDPINALARPVLKIDNPGAGLQVRASGNLGDPDGNA